MRKLIAARAVIIPLPLVVALTCLNIEGQAQRRTTTAAAAGSATNTTRRRKVSASEAQLTGVYRIDLESSDKLYSVVAGASSNLPFQEQQRFFIDLAARLTPPDLLAIERRGRTVTLASSRAPRLTFEADGVAHVERAQAADAHPIRTLAALNDGCLTVSTSGGTNDKFTVTFEPVDGGRTLRVTRRIHAAELNEPIVIESVYNRISDTAQWNISGEQENSRPTQTASNSTTRKPPVVDTAPHGATTSARSNVSDEVATLQDALAEWIAATNARDIGKQMSFYPAMLKAFYLTRNVTRSFVRAEKERVFNRATLIDVRADAPEIIFVNGGSTAIMRFDKRYLIEGGAAQNHRGEVIQELRWQKTAAGWKIFSERDVKVLR